MSDADIAAFDAFLRDEMRAPLDPQAQLAHAPLPTQLDRIEAKLDDAIRRLEAVERPLEARSVPPYP